MKNEWERYSLSIPYYLTEKEQLLEKLACEYHERCEFFDAIVCSSIGKDGPIPTNIEEASAINKHARDVMADILQRNPQIKSEELTNVIRQIAHAIPRRGLRNNDRES